MPEIKCEESLLAWMRSRPREDATLIAARGALRGLPGLARLFFGFERIDDPYTLILPCWRASIVASVAGGWPKHRRQVVHAALSAANAAAHSARAAAYTARSAADSATKSADSAAAPTAARSARTAARSAARAAFCSAARSTAWNVMEQDTNRLEDGMPHADLLALPLWHDAAVPKGLAENWSALRDKLLESDPLWHVWTDWYQDRQEGNSMIEALELAKAQIPDEDWEKGPAHVNGIIAKMNENYTTGWRPDRFTRN